MYRIDDKEKKNICDTIETMNYFRYQGPGVETQTSLCEKEWNDYLESSFSLLVTSGTNALVVGMASFGIGPGDEVIIPAYTFVATASAVMQVGAIPVIANIDESLTLDVKELEKCLSDRTKAVIAVHMDGLICNLEGIKSFCEAKGLLMIEDAAQAVGGEYKKEKVGRLGDFGAFSFNMDKVISCGEGGLLIMGEEHEKERKRAWITHDTACQYGHTMKEELEGVEPFFGISSRLNDVNSAMLRAQLEKLPEIVTELRAKKNMWREALEAEKIPFFEGYDREGDTSTCIHIKCSDPMAATLLTRKIIATGMKVLPPHFKPAHACWQWVQAMSKKDYFVPGLNPYKLTDREYSYEKAKYLPTVMILGQCLKVVFDLKTTKEEEQERINNVLSAFKTI